MKRKKLLIGAALLALSTSALAWGCIGNYYWQVDINGYWYHQHYGYYHY